MERKNILWLVSWYPNRDDAYDGDFIQRHARAAAIDNNIHVIFVKDTEIDKLVQENWNYVTGLTEQIIYFKKDKGLLGRIKKQLRWKKLYLQAVKNYIQKNGIPYCVHVHIPWKAGLIALELKKKQGIDFMATEHWGIYNKILTDQFYKKPVLVRTLIKKIIAQSKVFISVSTFLGEAVRQIVPNKEFKVIPNVVDTTLFFLKEEKQAKVFTFLHVSNMVNLKNVKGIVNAFHRLVQEGTNNVRLIMLGNKNQQHVQLAQSLGLLNNHIFFKGEVPYKEVAKEMQQANCFILNSIMENSPCTIAEALCCGLPVIATEVGGIPEMVTITNGVLIPSLNDEALTIAMQKMMVDSSSYNRQQIATEAAKKYGYAAIAGQFQQLYQTEMKAGIER